MYRTLVENRFFFPTSDAWQKDPIGYRCRHLGPDEEIVITAEKDDGD